MCAKALPVALATIAFAGVCGAQTHAKRPQLPEASARRAIAAVLDSVLSHSTIPGVVVGVAYDDGRSFAVAKGLSDIASKTPMSERSRFHAGSAGKTFFAAWALSLVREGTIRLDDQVGSYLETEPWFPRLPNHDAITLRMLLNHTSGLGEYGMSLMDSLVADPGRPRTQLACVMSVLDSDPKFPAGTGWSYSDVNYQVLALALEHATGHAAYDEIGRRFLRPLHLDLTSPANRVRFTGLAQGYAGSGNPFGGDRTLRGGSMVFNPGFEGGGGGFISNPRDLARWLVAIGTGAAYGDTLLLEATRGVPAPSLGRDAEYGLGLHVDHTALGPAIGHGGYFPGYLTSVRYYRDLGMAVAIQVNTSDNTRLSMRLEDVLERVARAALTGR